jgi:hypothetical protein
MGKKITISPEGDIQYIYKDVTVLASNVELDANKNYIVGTLDTPVTGNITIDYDINGDSTVNNTPLLGKTIIIIHNASSIPSIIVKKSSTSTPDFAPRWFSSPNTATANYRINDGLYQPNQNNIIQLQYLGGSEPLISVFQVGLNQYDQRRYKFFAEDFFGQGQTRGYSSIVANGGAFNTTSINNVAGRYGIMQLQLATNANAAAAQRLIENNIVPGTDIVVHTASIRLPILSDATDAYTVWVGFMTNDTSLGADYAAVSYTHSVNSGAWTVQSSNGTTTNTGSSGLTMVANTWYDIMVVLERNTRVLYFINGQLMAVHLNSVPDAGVKFGTFALKSAGTTTRNIDIDYQSTYVR